MEILEYNDRFCVQTQGFSVDWKDTPFNRKVAVIFLRGLRDAGGKRLFSLEELAGIVGSCTRQAVSQHVEDFRECGEDFGGVLTRKRKVDGTVVAAVKAEVEATPLADTEALRKGVCQRLGREDLS